LEVFGVSGAFPMYRRSALEQIAFADGNFFDESYFMYKEDADVAYRLRSAGMNSVVLLVVVAYHDRSGAGPKEVSDWAAAENKKKHPEVVRYHSYKNHLMTLYKNEYWQNALLDWPWIIWYEGKKFGWFLLFDREVLKGLGDVWKLRKELKKKRIEIKNKRKLDWREMRKCWRLL
jgi:GT2 family glycosyltransferase